MVSSPAFAFWQSFGNFRELGARAEGKGGASWHRELQNHQPRITCVFCLHALPAGHPRLAGDPQPVTTATRGHIGARENYDPA